jgi:cyclase
MWRRILIGIATVLLIAIAVAGYQLYSFMRIEAVKIDDRFWVMLGGGGNTAVLIGDDGVLVVDTKFWRAGRVLPDMIKAITDKPVKVIINTHYHADHTHGNSSYPAATDIIAQRRTRQHLLDLDTRFWEVEPAWDRLPTDLVDDEKEIHFGDETVRIIHPGRGHTDGDVVVQFVTRGIVHCGDLFVHGWYPHLDLRGGGSAREWPATLDKVLALADVTRYIPGHGPLAGRQEVIRFQSYLRSLVAQVDASVQRGQSLHEAQAAIDLHEYDDFRGRPFFTSRAENIATVFRELTAKKE